MTDLKTDLKIRLKQDMIAAMKVADKPLLATIRSINALIKQFEVDQRIEADDTKVLELLEKARKQRIESIKQYQQGNREDLVEVERFELAVIDRYLPEKLSASALQKVVDEIIADVQPKGMMDMSKVMAEAKKRLQGQADMALVSQLAKQSIFQTST